MSTESDIQHKAQRKAPGEMAFENGEPVLVAWPTTGEGEAEPSQASPAASIDRQEIIGEFSCWMARGNVSALEIGRRFLILQHLYRGDGTQRDLARRLRMDEGELSKKIQTLKMILANGINGN